MNVTFVGDSVNVLGNPLTIVILVIIIIVLCVLEFFLARKKQKIYGLILPIIAFFISLLFTFYQITNSTGIVRLTMVNDLENTISISLPIKGSVSMLTCIITFVAANIATLISLLIFFVNRIQKKDSLKKNKELEKMAILDLE